MANRRDRHVAPAMLGYSGPQSLATPPVNPESRQKYIRKHVVTKPNYHVGHNIQSYADSWARYDDRLIPDYSIWMGPSYGKRPGEYYNYRNLPTPNISVNGKCEVKIRVRRQP